MINLILSILTALIAWLGKWYTHKVACIIAYVALVAFLVTTLMGVISALLAGLSLIPPVAHLAQWAGFLLPTNARLIFMVLVSNKIAHMFFRFQKQSATIAAIKC
jgi:hypothetical protein